jgi:hypothetical protein
MLPVRINLLLWIVTILFLSCNAKARDNKVLLQKTVEGSKEQLPSSIIVENKVVQLKKDKRERPASKNKVLGNNSSITGNKIMPEYKSPQSFLISSERDTTLSGEEGTVIKIKHGSFVCEGTDIEVTGDITFHLAEYYKLSDILSANLSTESNGRILETGGMIFLEALSDGKQCELKKNSEIEIQFPYSDRKEGMQLFAGKWENDNLNWELIDSFSDLVFTCIETVAYFPGGEEPLLKFISRNVNYPDSLVDRGLSGRVSVKFEIDKTGKARFLEIIEPSKQAFEKTMQKIFLNMPLWKPAIQNGRPIASQRIQPVTFILEGQSPTYDTIYKKEFEQKIENDTLLSNVTSAEIDMYVLSSSKLGWINCDRFYNEKAQRLDLFVKTDNYDEMNVKLIFKKFKSVLMGKPAKDGFIFSQVPIDEKITVLAIGSRGKKNYMAIGDYPISVAKIDDLKFEQITRDILMKKIAQLSDR